jgi:hypothetical protein
MVGSRSPGIACPTTSRGVDRGTLCTIRSDTPELHGTRPAESTKRVRFAALWAGYPSTKPYLDPKTGSPPKGFENQCAIKVSVALHAVGIDMKSYRGSQVVVEGKPAATRATELAAWLNSQYLPSLPVHGQTVTGEDWQKKVKGRTGIIYFANYWARPGEAAAPSGDHIDLWNGSRLTATGLEGVIVDFLRFGLDIQSGPGFSNLGKATTILFLEVQ